MSGITLTLLPTLGEYVPNSLYINPKSLSYRLYMPYFPIEVVLVRPSLRSLSYNSINSNLLSRGIELVTIYVG